MIGRWTAFAMILAAWALLADCNASAGGGIILAGTDAGGSDGTTATGDTGNPTTCPTNRNLCGTTCVNLQTSATNCGACASPCASGQSCVAGACSTAMGCSAGQVMCSGTCTDTTSDPANCGACGHACTGSQTCTSSACVAPPTCTPPMTLCGTTCTNTSTDNNNCGVCGLPCSSGEVCTAGDCTTGSGHCASGQTMCGETCTSTSSDPSNCGGCGAACASGQSCRSGVCTTSSTGSTVAGSTCTSDADCGSLSCDTSIAGGWCSLMCTETGTSSEATECGGGAATCLSIGDTMPSSYCAAACTPGSVGDCRSGFVCTGWWYTHAMATPDATGCFPFCRTNSDCGASDPVCDVRTGNCGPSGFVATRLADGSTCNPSITVPDSMGNPENVQCRGVCFQVGTGATEGICGSFINVAYGTTCPDSPTTIQAEGLSGMDDLGLCIFASCTTTANCSAGLQCIVPTGGTAHVCTYAS